MRPQPIPREKIPWFPTVNLDACIGDRECVDFCENDVFQWDAKASRPMVDHPYNCVLGCSACKDICPAEAISFPAMQELRETMRRLRAETAVAAAAV